MYVRRETTQSAYTKYTGRVVHISAILFIWAIIDELVVVVVIIYITRQILLRIVYTHINTD